MSKLEKILILDFGSQYTQLIARKIREMKVFSEIVSPYISLQELLKHNPKGIILSGGPNSLQQKLSGFAEEILNLDIPILGICFGMQLMTQYHQGSLSFSKTREYGKSTLHAQEPHHVLFKNFLFEKDVWMSHQDTVVSLPLHFKVIATSDNGQIAAISHKSKPHFGLQFHPEVSHTENGSILLKNFLKCCQVQENWDVQNYIEAQVDWIKKKVKQQKVISLVSGGIDSMVSTLLCLKALGPEKVYSIHIDTGLMRSNESVQVIDTLKKCGFENLIFEDASKEFLSLLKGVKDPEEKRQKIGNLFMEILNRTLLSLNLSEDTFICQGTLYTDLIESGHTKYKGAALIKSHHNVNCTYVEEKRKKGLILEPNRYIFKDEVRKIAAELSLQESIIDRHPFPGPGLAIRILGEVTERKLNILRQIDQIYLEEITKAGLYKNIWQAFAVLLPQKSVGVIGDQRTTGYIAALRAVDSIDGMTADFSKIDYTILSKLSTRIVNEVSEVSRVVYDITSKPPATIEWE
ncbi:MAG: glutamine-hydrolyzing GMP synthase [Chlamydiota bacterium]|jgi:GMP synthase (glutamine-hydrolysing)